MDQETPRRRIKCEQEEEFLSISQNVYQEKQKRITNNYNENDQFFGESVRGGASTRRELFNESQRKQDALDLAIFKTKLDENEDIPISEEAQTTQNFLKGGVEKRITLQNLIDNQTKLQDSKKDDSDFSNSQSDNESSSDDDSSCSNSTDRKIDKYTSEYFRNGTAHLAECEDGDDKIHCSDGKYSSGTENLPDNQYARSHLPPFPLNEKKNSWTKVLEDQKLHKSKEEQISPFNKGYSNQAQFDSQLCVDKNISICAGELNEYSSAMLQNQKEISQQHSESPFNAGKFRRGIKGINYNQNPQLGNGKQKLSGAGISIAVPKKKKGQIQKKNYLSIIYFVKKFENILKTSSTAFKFRSMTKKHFKMIGDLSSNYSYYRLRSYLHSDTPKWHELLWHSIQSGFRQLVLNPLQNHYFTKILIYKGANKIGVLQPESFMKQLWDMFSIIIIVANLFYIPVRISFFFNQKENDTIDIYYIFLYILPLSVMIFDLVLKLNTAFYKNGLVIFDRTEIFLNYVHTQFLWDFFVILPYLISGITGVVELKAFVLFRFNRVLIKLKQFEERLNLSDTQAAYVGLFKLIFLIIFIAHICGCGFFLVSQIERHFGYSPIWTDKINMDNSQIMSQYITSLYWSVITMITLGYGDVVPINTAERAFVVFVTMIACGVFAFSLNKIGHLILEIGKLESEQRKKINMLMDLMLKRGLTNVSLLMKVRRNFQYLLNQAQENNLEGQKFLLQLDANLKDEVMRDIYGKMLLDKKIFKLNFSQEIIDSLCLKMKEKRYAPEDVIFSENDIVDKLYFVVQGEVISYINLTSKKKAAQTVKSSADLQIQVQILAHLNKGDVFGEKSFFSNSKSEYGVKACSVVTIAYLSLTDLMEVLKQREGDLERFCVLRDNLQIYNVTQGLGVKCFGCNKYTHTIIQCPQSKYIPNQEKILFNNGISSDQVRCYKTRRKLRVSNTLAIFEVLNEAAIKFIIDTYGYEALQYYFEDRDNDTNNVHSPYNNLNSKAIEHALQQQTFQIQHQPHNVPQCHEIVRSNSNQKSPKQKIPSHLAITLNSTYQESNAQEKQFINKRASVRSRLKELSIISDEAESSSAQMKQNNLCFSPKKEQNQFQRSLSAREDPQQNQIEESSSNQVVPFKATKNILRKIDTANMDIVGIIPSFDNSQQQFLVTPKGKASQQQQQQSTSSHFIQQQQQQQFQTQQSVSSNANKSLEKEKLIHLFSSQGQGGDETEQEAEFPKQRVTLSHNSNNQSGGQSNNYYFERQASFKKRNDSCSIVGNSELMSKKEAKPINNNFNSNNNNNNVNSNNNNNNNNNRYNTLKIELEEEEVPYFILDEFDCAKEYEIYFPHNNLEHVLLQYHSNFCVDITKSPLPLNSRQDVQKLLQGIRNKLPKQSRKSERKMFSSFYKGKEGIKGSMRGNQLDIFSHGSDFGMLKLKPLIQEDLLPDRWHDSKSFSSKNKQKHAKVDFFVDKQIRKQIETAKLLNEKSNLIFSSTDQIYSNIHLQINPSSLEHNDQASQHRHLIPLNYGE